MTTEYFYIYSSHKLVQQGKWPKPVDVYYFSNTAVSNVEALSVKNLQAAFTGNAKFRYLLESQFTTDNALVAYDSAANEYKIKYLYEHSISM